VAEQQRRTFGICRMQMDPRRPRRGFELEHSHPQMLPARPA
jgi:hypothetical protein